MKRDQMNKFLSVILLVFVLTSCSSYQKALKSEDVAVKYAEAEKMYEKGKYSKAIRLFEQMATTFRGKPQAEKMYYMFSQSYYKTKQYYLAGYQFESFVSGYPKSEKIEEAAYLGAKSYSMLSPVYSIDQTDTFKAIDKLQAFIDRFPDSQYLAEANVSIKALREKIEKKVLFTANQRASDLGIIILDFRIKRINYVQEVQDQVYKRMTSERFRIADKFRSEGQGEASRINGEKERELKSIQSEAFKLAEEIKGKSDAKAAAIYAAAYNQSAQSKNLYAFLKSLEAFEKTFDKNTSIILSTDSELYKYLKSLD